MALETGTYLHDLVTTNPLGTDPRSQGDNHLRLLKTVLKATFPGFAGRFSRVQAQGGTYTAVVNDSHSLLRFTATATLNLPSAATAGSGYSLYVQAYGGVVTVDPDGAETVNDAATLALASGTIALLTCTGTAWIAMVVPSWSYASQGEAEAGTDNLKVMTPLRTAQSIAALVPVVPDASTTVKGIVELATAAEAQALTDAVRAVTPSTLKGALQGSNQSLVANGYQKLPGGLIVQWGTTAATGSDTTITFPLAFPTAVLAASVAGKAAAALSSDVSLGSTFSTTQMNARHGAGPDSIVWIALGH